jgi:hypothetical protein
VSSSLKLLGFSDIRKVVSWRNELVTRTEKGEDGEPVMVLMPRVTIVDADARRLHFERCGCCHGPFLSHGGAGVFQHPCYP